MVRQQIERAKEKPREELLENKPRSEKHKDAVFCTVPFSPATAKIPGIMKKHFPLLQQGNTTKAVFPKHPTTSYRRGRTLRDLLVKAGHPFPLQNEHGTPLPNGFFKCPSQRCIVHKHITNTSNFRSTVTNQEYPITSHITCKSSWVIYLITCTRCNKQYVGKTETTLYTRFNNTRSEIKNFHSATQHKILPYTVHFNLPSHSLDNVQITGIELIHNKSRHTILHRESFWI